MKNFYYDRETLRLELLPKDWESQPMAFSYRATSSRGAEYQNAYTPFVLFTASLLAAWVIFVLRFFFINLYDFTPYAISWQLGVLVFCIAAGDALPRFFADERPTNWGTRALIPIVVWLWFICLVQPSWVLLVLLCFVTLFLVEVITNNYVMWLLADRRSDYGVCETIRGYWKKRFGPRSWLKTVLTLLHENREPQPTDTYLASWLLLGLGFGVSAIAFRHVEPLRGGMLTLVALCLWQVVQAVLIVFLARMGPIPLRLRVKTTASALRIWLSYNPRDKKAPGLFQSPLGGSWKRLLIICGGVGLITSALMLVASYYPLMMLGPEREAPWLRQLAWQRTAQGWNPHRSRHGGLLHSWFSPHEPYARILGASTPTTEEDFKEVADSLTPAEQTYYNQLSTDDARRAFLRRIAKSPRIFAQRRIPFEMQDLAFLRSTPEAWLLPNFYGLWEGKQVFIFSLILTVCLAMAAPVGFLFLAVFAVSSAEMAIVEYVLLLSAQEKIGSGSEYAGYNPEWLGLVESLWNSKNQLEREHIFLGFAQSIETDDEVPVLFHRDMIKEHVYINGASGSGKSSRGIGSIGAQLAHFVRGDQDTPADRSILVIDLKGDKSLFHGMRAEARDVVPFKWYRDQIGRSSWGFNPLLQSHVQFLSPAQKASVLMNSFGLRSEENYGARYFADIQETVIRRVFEVYPNVRSLRDINNALNLPNAKNRLCPNMPSRDWEQAHHVFVEIETLSRSKPLNDPTAELERRIDIPSLFKIPQIVYFYVPASVGRSSNVHAAKLALYSLLTSAHYIEDRPISVYCIIDEFQEIVGPNLGIILRQARSFDVGLILANQLPSDLDQAGAKLEETVKGNVSLSWSFRPTTAKEQDQLIAASGEYLETLRGMTLGASHETENEDIHSSQRTAGDTQRTAGDTQRTSITDTMSQSYTYSQQYRPAFNKNRVLWASFVNDLSIAHFSHASGYTAFFRPFALRTIYHVTKELFQKRDKEPWPLLPFPPGRGGSRGDETNGKAGEAMGGGPRPLPDPKSAH